MKVLYCSIAKCLFWSRQSRGERGCLYVVAMVCSMVSVGPAQRHSGRLGFHCRYFSLLTLSTLLINVLMISINSPTSLFIYQHELCFINEFWVIQTHMLGAPCWAVLAILSSTTNGFCRTLYMSSILIVCCNTFALSEIEILSI